MGLFKGINIGANAIKFIFAIVGVILSALIIVRWDEELKNVSDVMPYLDGSLVMVWGALIVCIAVAVLFGIYQFISNIKRNKGGLIGLVAFGAILAVSFGVLAKTKLMDYRALRGGKFEDPEVDYNGLTDGWLTLSEGGVYAVYILIGIAVLAAVVAEVTKLIK
ncbi:MAG: hypothetical protein AB8B53_05655 [Flavobacteriales bacterium]